MYICRFQERHLEKPWCCSQQRARPIRKASWDSPPFYILTWANPQCKVSGQAGSPSVLIHVHDQSKSFTCKWEKKNVCAFSFKKWRWPNFSMSETLKLWSFALPARPPHFAPASLAKPESSSAVGPAWIDVVNLLGVTSLNPHLRRSI